MTRTLNRVKIHEALDVLSSAAADEQSGLRDMIDASYGSLKDVLGSLGNERNEEWPAASYSSRWRSTPAHAVVIRDEGPGD